MSNHWKYYTYTIKGRGNRHIFTGGFHARDEYDIKHNLKQALAWAESRFVKDSWAVTVSETD